MGPQCIAVFHDLYKPESFNLNEGKLDHLKIPAMLGSGNHCQNIYLCRSNNLHRVVDCLSIRRLLSVSVCIRDLLV